MTTVHVVAEEGHASKATRLGSFLLQSNGRGRGEEIPRWAFHGKRKTVAPQPVIVDRQERGLLPKWATNLIRDSHFVISVHLSLHQVRALLAGGQFMAALMSHCAAYIIIAHLSHIHGAIGPN